MRLAPLVLSNAARLSRKKCASTRMQGRIEILPTGYVPVGFWPDAPTTRRNATRGCRMYGALARERRLGIERDKSLELAGFLMALQAVHEIDLDLRVVKTGCGESIDN